MSGTPLQHALSFATLLALLPLVGGQTSPADTEQLANHALGLERSQLLQLSLSPDLSKPIEVGGLIGGVPVVLQLEPTEVLAEDFRLMTQAPDGSWTVVEHQPTKTLRGTLLGHPESQVAASLLGDGLHARILVDSGEFWLEPLARAVPTAEAGAHVLYSTANVLQNVGVCGTDSLANARPALFGGASVYGTGQLNAAAGFTAELACDADYEYYLDYGSANAVQNRIATVINTMNLQYESEVDITHTITTILVRTSANQPYTSTDAGTLLTQFQAEWNSNQGSIQRDVAQLFTGKEINSSTIGIAWLGVICNSTYGYSMVQSDFNGNFASATDLSAHELGHNWSADHCNCTSNTMNPFITSANTFHPSFTIPEIVSHRDSRSCLDSGPPPPAATTLHVGGLSASTTSQGKGKKAGRATVTVLDNNGVPVSNATVTVSFTGQFTETRTGTTNANGVAVIDTNATAKGKINFTVCVDNITHGTLSYNSSSNTTTCNSI